MNFADINEMLVFNPGEHLDNVSTRCSFALECAIDIIRQHMDSSVDTQCSYDESDICPLIVVGDDTASVVSNEIEGLQVQIENMVNREEVLHKLNALVISPTDIAVYPTKVSVYWYFEKPLLIQSEREQNLLTYTIASIMFDLGLNKLADFYIIMFVAHPPTHKSI